MKTLPQVLLDAYRNSPEQVCIHLLYSAKPEETITYRQLIEGACAYANQLARAGVKPGEVVILILEHGEALLYGFFGAILQGAIPSIMPFLTEKLSPEHYRTALTALFEIVTPAGVITSQAFAPEVTQASTREVPRAVLLSEQIATQGPGGLTSLAGFQRMADEIVLLQHSSGTTGLQKGVALSHQAVFNQLKSYTKAIRLTREDTVVSWLPLYHDMGLIAGFILPILCRVPLVLMSPFDWVRAPQRLLRAVSDYHGTLTWLPNFAYNFCAQKIRPSQLDGVDLTTWRAVINCSEPMHWSSHEKFLERFQPFGLRSDALATCYAMAETVFAVTQGGIESQVTVDEIDSRALTTQQMASPSSNKEHAIKMLSAGPPIENTRLRVLDSRGRDLPERHIGEIAIHSDCMLNGYFNRPDLTEKAFMDSWYLSGDLGYLANGELYITGRKKDLIIVGGKNIYPQDLERIAGDIPGVHPGRAVAFGVFNPEMGTEEVVMLVESDEHDPVKLQAIAEQTRLRVTRGSDVALRIVQVVERGWLLKTSSGKISRSANREKYIEEISRPIPAKSPQADL